MTMQMRYMIEKPGEVKFTAKITMTADQWEALRDQLNRAEFHEQPARFLREKIIDILAQARKIYYRTPKNPTS